MVMFGSGISMGMFQSPSLRGSGRFHYIYPVRSLVSQEFQSPSLRGSGRFEADPDFHGIRLSLVSIPFIAGQWSLRGGSARAEGRRTAFQSPSLRGSGRFNRKKEDEEVPF